MMGVRLVLLYPEVAGRDCEDCKKWVYEDSPDAMAEGPMEFPPGSGKPNPRIPLPQFGPRCDWCPKVPKGDPPKPESAVELSAKNWRAYRHYLECRAIGTFGAAADDPIVRRNAMLIKRVQEEAEQVRNLRSSVLALGSVFKKGR